MAGHLRDDGGIDVGPLRCLGRGQVSESGPGDDDLMALGDSGGLAHRPRGSAGPVGSGAVGPAEDGGSAD